MGGHDTNFAKQVVADGDRVVWRYINNFLDHA